VLSTPIPLLYEEGPMHVLKKNSGQLPRFPYHSSNDEVRTLDSLLVTQDSRPPSLQFYLPLKPHELVHAVERESLRISLPSGVCFH